LWAEHTTTADKAATVTKFKKDKQFLEVNLSQKQLIAQLKTYLW